MRAKRHLKYSLFTVMLLIPLFAISVTAEAGEYRRTRTFTGPAGHSATKNVTAHRTNSGYSRTATVTGPHGNTATRQSSGSWDPATQTWSRNVSVTGPAGYSASKSVSGARTDNGYSRTATVTGPYGNTATRQSSGSWDPATRTWSRNVSVIGPAAQ